MREIGTWIRDSEINKNLKKKTYQKSKNIRTANKLHQLNTKFVNLIDISDIGLDVGSVDFFYRSPVRMFLDFRYVFF